MNPKAPQLNSVKDVSVPLSLWERVGVRVLSAISRSDPNIIAHHVQRPSSRGGLEARDQTLTLPLSQREREPDASALVVRNLAAGKGRDNAFCDLSFDVPPASFVALVGANGSGKTTLFETLLGLVAPRTGSLQVLGVSPAQARTSVAYVPQADRLMHDGQFIGREFVAAAYQGQRWGIPWRSRTAMNAVDRALAHVDARDLAQRKLADLSGGERQRLLIAQALVNAPRLMLMDEPLAQLDPAAQSRIVALAAHLRDTHGITVVFSTHDINPVVQIADQVLYLANQRGRLGPVNEVITDSVLSDLYGVPMHVIRHCGQLFVIRDQTPDSIACEYRAADDSQRLEAS